MLVYQDAHRTTRLSAEHLAIVQTGMGTEVSFTTLTDAGTAAMTVLMPLVTLGASGTASIHTVAVNTVLQPVPGGGTHEVIALAGTAGSVASP